MTEAKSESKRTSPVAESHLRISRLRISIQSYNCQLKFTTLKMLKPREFVMKYCGGQYSIWKWALFCFPPTTKKFFGKLVKILQQIDLDTNKKASVLNLF